MKRTKTVSRSVSRLLALLLLGAMLFVCACSEASEESGDISGASSENASDAASSPLEPTDIPPGEVDLNQRVINVLCKDFTAATIQGYTGEILYSEEDNSSAVDIAKKAVIDHVETAYHCTIDGKLDKSSDLILLVQNMVISGTYDYDIVFTNLDSLVAMGKNGSLTDLHAVETLNLGNSWWDQNAVEQLSIAHKLFYVNGDINTFDDLGTFCVLFNKSLKERLNIEEDFYETVRKGSWTLDHFMDICKGVTAETNGDGVLNEFDQWALGTETYNVFVQVVGGGLHIIEKDAKDEPYIALRTNPQQHYNALDKIISFYQSADVMVANDGTYAQYGDNVHEETVNKAFREGRELFYMGGLFNLAAFRDMKDDIGVLPIPKTFAEQDDYYHTISIYGTTFLAIPKGVPGVEDLGLVIEALAMKSKEMLTPAFYDTQLKYRDLRDNESGEVLDLIFATRSYDLGPAYKWGNLLTAYCTLDSNYVSRFESILDAAETAMNDTVENMLAQ